MRNPVVDNSIYYERGPVGVLLIHGLTGTPVEMRDTARRLAAGGHTVLCCQLAGHCGTEQDLVATNFEDWYESAVKGIERLEKHCSQILVGGLSMGAVLSALVAARQPKRVHGVIMLAPTLTYDGWSIPKYSFLLRIAMQTPLGRFYRFEEREPFGLKDERARAMVAYALKYGNSAESGLISKPATSLRELWRLTAALKPLLPQINQRTLVIQARQDDVASLGNMATLQRELGGLVDTMVLNDSYHIITVDQQRHLVGERVLEFVNRFARGAASEVPYTVPARAVEKANGVVSVGHALPDPGSRVGGMSAGLAPAGVAHGS
ncbi:carboxylesterase [Angulomicrobium tetraedrale]|uniref:Carboxylesterase n=1 Tax=Ancylobacter tetraedralis TaxID=217068 RepID=A0A839YZH2_9HYPH|nr:alpha/beta fold hydrolase [Ancylobacter tetraedralis]MBB3769914.1 carboxylesterase [Ancylobacter tetraedralis]